MSINVGEAGAKRGDDDKGAGDSGDEDEVKLRGADLGPPGFYDNDVDRYFAKFDKSIKERNEYKT